ncbi:Oidioi.mRNA.OKI2018_I69.chr2.g5472.t1.cds [Oikopleura dioica]|uniref:Oidioi.mRNA.OKI2018_I69.chr2.g5472.t1.cds n=1 Tax=Oikopleura dioica TaxID=34765 RepID=A0ABN7T0Y8_OIKDI|nr:Oidioi.mRNA.OKI2018_I69.chr2.g5472.t1.cds [Oikopleura dioica]
MRIVLFLLSFSIASHFRAASLQYRKSSDPGRMEVTRYMGWRRGSAGYREEWIDGCTQAHIDNQTVSDMGIEYMFMYNIGNGTRNLQKVPALYIVTNIEDSPLVDEDSHFCFGSYTFEIDVSNIGYFSHMFSGCCTIELSNDTESISTGNYAYTAKVLDVNNSSPQFISPPIWYILDGCEGQAYHVNPVDSEGDTIRCRWSTSSESRHMAWNSGFQQFVLDEEYCIVTYRPEFDLLGEGSKPVAIQVEDFDANGTLLHSVPLAFVCVVFTPEFNSSRISSKIIDFTPACLKKQTITTIILMMVPGDFYQINSVRQFDTSDLQESQITALGEERVWVWTSGLNITIEWKASYTLGNDTFTDISRNQFSSPHGMTCTAFDSDGEATCSWTPTADQARQGEHPHCAVVYDPYGRASERRCTTLRVYPPCDVGTERVGSACLAVCNSGYQRDDNGDCIKICSNNIGSFTCLCTSGYERIESGVCIDIDECGRGTDTCAPTIENCVNTFGSFHCPCSSGYERDADGDCVNIDECSKGTDTCNDFTEDCEDVPGSFTCACASGYSADATGTCVDDDECAAGTHTCTATTETCVNTLGSFDCPCSSGYERDDDGLCKKRLLLCLHNQERSEKAMLPLFYRYLLCKKFTWRKKK